MYIYIKNLSITYFCCVAVASRFTVISRKHQSLEYRNKVIDKNCLTAVSSASSDQHRNRQHVNDCTLANTTYIASKMSSVEWFDQARRTAYLIIQIMYIYFSWHTALLEIQNVIKLTVIKVYQTT